MNAIVDGRRLGSKRRVIVIGLLLALISLSATPAHAQARLVVRDSLGLSGLNLLCPLLGCQVVRGLGDPQGQLFLITFPSILNPVTALLKLNLQLGIVDAEIDQIVNTQAAYAGPAPSYLTDEKPTSYYGTTVWHGYVAQPANQLIRTSTTQSTYHVTGSGVTVAVIDTGVDPTNPVLQNLLVSGYDFTRNTNGGSEKSDVSTSPDLSQAQTAQVNQRTVAVLDQRTVAVLDSSQYSAFGHGTMTAGIVHLVARYSASHLLRGEKWRQGAQHELRLSELLARARQCHQICEQQRSNLSGVGRKRRQASSSVSRRVTVCDRRCLYLELGYPIRIHELWRASGLDSCSRRRCSDDLSVGHLCRWMGNFVQHALRQWDRCPDARYQRELHQL